MPQILLSDIYFMYISYICDIYIYPHYSYCNEKPTREVLSVYIHDR